MAVGSLGFFLLLLVLVAALALLLCPPPLPLPLPLPILLLLLSFEPGILWLKESSCSRNESAVKSMFNGDNDAAFDGAAVTGAVVISDVEDAAGTAGTDAVPLPPPLPPLPLHLPLPLPLPLAICCADVSEP